MEKRKLVKKFVFDIYDISSGFGVFETSVESEEVAKSICSLANQNGKINKMYLKISA